MWLESNATKFTKVKYKNNKMNEVDVDEEVSVLNTVIY